MENQIQTIDIGEILSGLILFICMVTILLLLLRKQKRDIEEEKLKQKVKGNFITKAKDFDLSDDEVVLTMEDLLNFAKAVFFNSNELLIAIWFNGYKLPEDSKIELFIEVDEIRSTSWRIQYLDLNMGISVFCGGLRIVRRFINQDAIETSQARIKTAFKLISLLEIENDRYVKKQEDLQQEYHQAISKFLK